ncbi:C45 family autoproteolytic acyltransferase/hydrolase [Cytobacillus sp. Hm23]
MFFEEKVITGSLSEFMEVRHVKIKGSNFYIGKKLAEIGYNNHRALPYPATTKYKYQLEYFKNNYPILLDRIQGATDYFSNVNVEDNSYDFSSFVYSSGLPGCSVVFYPPTTTENGSPIVSRNFDFATGTISGEIPADDEKPAFANPYILELHPDEGYSSLCVSGYDMLSGVLDGINSEGLVVTLLADDDAISHYPIEPTYQPQVGLNELQILRLLLDTCANIEEAKKALYMNKHYYTLYPLHFLIADKHGNSFVWEQSHGRNKEFTFDGDKNHPQVVTNFPLYKYQSESQFPDTDDRLSMYNRFCNIKENVKRNKAPYSIDFIKNVNQQVSFHDHSHLRESQCPTRTLWHSIYNIEDRTILIDFYLGEENETIKRSGYIHFSL